MSYSPTDLVLLTGANGHLAQHIVSHLLSLDASQSPRIRATVRSAASAAKVEAAFQDAIKNERVEVIRVEDIVKVDAWDQCIQGVTHVAHVASPVTFDVVDDVANQLLNPAIQGTLGILRAAARAPSVRAVSITSSFGAIFDPMHGLRPGHTYTEHQFNPTTYEQAASPNLDLNAYPETYRPYVTYCASKVCAERAAWDFVKTEKPSFTLTTILPVYIGGPSILPLPASDPTSSLSVSQKLIWQCATGKLPTLDFVGWVEVRDVARAQANALVKPEAQGRRFIVCATMVTYSDIAGIIRKNFPSLSPSTEVQNVDHYIVNGTTALQTLGLGSYIPLEKGVVDTVQQIIDAGGSNASK